jgi:beta-glucosidase
MGPSAAAALTGGGGSAHGVPYAGVRSPFAALRGRAGKGAILSWLPGYDLDGAAVPADVLAPPVPTGVAGLLRQNITADVPAPGTPPALQPGGAPDQVDPGVDYTGARALPAGTAWRWSGTITAPTTGRYQLKVQVANQARASLIIDGVETPKPAIDLNAFPKDGVDGLRQVDRTRSPRGLQQRTVTVPLAAGQPHTIDLRAVAGGAPMQVRLAWVTPQWPGQKIAEAVAAARRAKKAIVFAYDETGEGDDQRRMTLPGYQDKLITAVARANPRTIVVLNTGGAVKMPWLRRVAAVLEMWYPGQRGGQATAKVLLGRADPGGRLPVTFPTSLRRQPSFSPDGSRYPGVVVPGTTFPTAVNSEGILVGYRWYDALRVRPLFEFGHGLSYTTFAYSDLLVRPRGDGHDVSFIVRNTGARTGADVPQVYLGPAAGSPVPMPQRALAGFRRVVLRPGQARRVRVHVGARELSYWSSEQQRWVVASGRRNVWVGPSSRELPLRGRTTATTAR